MIGKATSTTYPWRSASKMSTGWSGRPGTGGLSMKSSTCGKPFRAHPCREKPTGWCRRVRTPGNRRALHGWRCAARRSAGELVFLDKPRLPITPPNPHLAKASAIRDIAALAKVSKATVSRYLNGTLDLPQETRRRIDDAVLALNYRQNSLARRL